MNKDLVNMKIKTFHRSVVQVDPHLEEGGEGGQLIYIPLSYKLLCLLDILYLGSL